MPTKQKLVFVIPDILLSNTEGYDYLSHISLHTYNLQKQTIEFDFYKNSSFESNLCSPFGALIAGLKERENLVNIRKIREDLKTEFLLNGFTDILNLQLEENLRSKQKMSFKRFTLEDNASFLSYVNEDILAQKDFPHISTLLKKKINSCFIEIFNNAHTHGGCEFVYTCGKYFDSDQKLKFTISDMGTTIRKNVNDYFKSGNEIDGQKAINWAVQEGNTTKKGEIPGGLGLSLIREFLKLNHGGMQIISSNGYWEEINGRIFAANMKNRFLGTIVNFEFNLNDKNSYKLSSEINPKNVL